MQMAPDYDHLTLMQKVEVFEHAVNNTAGDDLAKLLWLKSPSSEVGHWALQTCALLDPPLTIGWPSCLFMRTQWLFFAVIGCRACPDFSNKNEMGEQDKFTELE